MMMRNRIAMLGSAALVTCGVWTATAWAAEEGHATGQHEMKAQMPAPPPLSPLLDRFRKLEGTWEGTPTQQQPGMPDKYSVTYRPTAGGSAVVETWFPGTDHEMVSVYHADGDRIEMTHYCMLGNQPRMTATPAPGSTSNGAVLEFVCKGGGNLADHNAPHMHSATYRFIDADHMQIAGTLSSDGKVQDCGVVDYHRVGSPSAVAGGALEHQQVKSEGAVDCASAECPRVQSASAAAGGE